MKQLFRFNSLFSRPFVTLRSFTHRSSKRRQIIPLHQGLAIGRVLEPMFGIEGRINVLRLMMHAQEAHVIKECKRVAFSIAKQNSSLGRAFRHLHEMNFGPSRRTLGPDDRSSEPAREIGRLGIVKLMAQAFGQCKEETLKRTVDKCGRKPHAHVGSRIARNELDQHVACQSVLARKGPGRLDGLESPLVGQTDVGKARIKCFDVAGLAGGLDALRPGLVLRLWGIGRNNTSCQMQ